MHVGITTKILQKSLLRWETVLIPKIAFLCCVSWCLFSFFDCPIHYAAESGNAEIIKLLVVNGANVFQLNTVTFVVLMFFCLF